MKPVANSQPRASCSPSDASSDEQESLEKSSDKSEKRVRNLYYVGMILKYCAYLCNVVSTFGQWGHPPPTAFGHELAKQSLI